MASYAEIFDILTFTTAGAADLRNRVGVATLITADKVRLGTDNVAPFDQTVGAHENRVLWAAKVYVQPRGATHQVFGAVVASNASVSESAILNATDAQIQAAVDGVADVFAVSIAAETPAI